ncbi:helix-turn-helix domain-containing protein [Terriglobus albidus]|uniref:helix-turn-helix domain-containing protein n=1 Tax=Terriglobus albidus TaxID=1592106 RepID=UPI00295B21B9|nr:helix-turn-helix domain-containing protein [Terriglobus albidus]
MSATRHAVRRPSEPLRPYIREMLWVRSEEDRVQTLLPESGMTLALRVAGAVTRGTECLPGMVISGIQGHARSLTHARGTETIIVRFTEAGAAAFLRENAGQFSNQTIDLLDVLPKKTQSRFQNLPESHATSAEYLDTVERHLADHLRMAAQISPPIAAATAMIRRHGGKLRSDHLARAVGMSERALERTFLREVGVRPKMLSRLARLEHVCELWDRGHSLTDVAQHAGYADQPHMVRDFRDLTGASPRRLFSSGQPRNLPVFYK